MDTTKMLINMYAPWFKDLERLAIVDGFEVECHSFISKHISVIIVKIGTQDELKNQLWFSCQVKFLFVIGTTRSLRQNCYMKLSHSRQLIFGNMLDFIALNPTLRALYDDRVLMCEDIGIDLDLWGFTSGPYNSRQDMMILRDKLVSDLCKMMLIGEFAINYDCQRYICRILRVVVSP